MDVVFNHTATFSFHALADSVYYMKEEGNHKNYSGCGNTMNCNHPIVRDLIMASLIYWATEMHVDGFRFDEAPILGRSTRGNIQDLAPLLVLISNEPLLKDTKLIAEAWDAGGAYQANSETIMIYALGWHVCLRPWMERMEWKVS